MIPEILIRQGHIVKTINIAWSVDL